MSWKASTESSSLSSPAVTSRHLIATEPIASDLNISTYSPPRVLSVRHTNRCYNTDLIIESGTVLVGLVQFVNVRCNSASVGDLSEPLKTVKCIESFTILLYYIKALDMKRGSAKPVAVVIPSKQAEPEQSNPE